MEPLHWLTALEMQRSMRRAVELEHVPRPPKVSKRSSAARIPLRILRLRKA